MINPIVNLASGGIGFPMILVTYLFFQGVYQGPKPRGCFVQVVKTGDLAKVVKTGDSLRWLVNILFFFLLSSDFISMWKILLMSFSGLFKHSTKLKVQSWKFLYFDLVPLPWVFFQSQYLWFANFFWPRNYSILGLFACISSLTETSNSFILPFLTMVKGWSVFGFESYTGQRTLKCFFLRVIWAFHILRFLLAGSKFQNNLEVSFFF